MSDRTAPEFPVGTHVVKDKGDYTFRGEVMAAFQKKSGQWRYVVENPEGILHVFSGAQLEQRERGVKILGT